MSKNATVQRQKLKATYREQPNILLPLNENIIIGQDQLLTGCSDEFASQYLKYLGVADNFTTRNLIHKMLPFNKCIVKPAFSANSNADMAENITIVPPQNFHTLDTEVVSTPLDDVEFLDVSPPQIDLSVPSQFSSNSCHEPPFPPSLMFIQEKLNKKVKNSPSDSLSNSSVKNQDTSKLAPGGGGSRVPQDIPETHFVPDFSLIEIIETILGNHYDSALTELQSINPSMSINSKKSRSSLSSKNGFNVNNHSLNHDLLLDKSDSLTGDIDTSTTVVSDTNANKIDYIGVSTVDYLLTEAKENSFPTNGVSSNTSNNNSQKKDELQKSGPYVISGRNVTNKPKFSSFLPECSTNLELRIQIRDTLVEWRNKFIFPFANIRKSAPLVSTDFTNSVFDWRTIAPSTALTVAVPSSAHMEVLVPIRTPLSRVGQFLKEAAFSNLALELLSSDLQRIIDYGMTIRQFCCSPTAIKFASVFAHNLYWEIFGAIHSTSQHFVNYQNSSSTSSSFTKNQGSKNNPNTGALSEDARECLQVSSQALFARLMIESSAVVPDASSLIGPTFILPCAILVLKVTVERIFEFNFPNFMNHPLCNMAFIDRLNVSFCRHFDPDATLSRFPALEGPSSNELLRMIRSRRSSHLILSFSDSNESLVSEDKIDLVKASLLALKRKQDTLSSFPKTARLCYFPHVTPLTQAASLYLAKIRPSPLMATHVIKNGKRSSNGATRAIVSKIAAITSRMAIQKDFNEGNMTLVEECFSPSSNEYESQQKHKNINSFNVNSTVSSKNAQTNITKATNKSNTSHHLVAFLRNSITHSVSEHEEQRLTVEEEQVGDDSNISNNENEKDESVDFHHEKLEVLPNVPPNMVMSKLNLSTFNKNNSKDAKNPDNKIKYDVRKNPNSRISKTIQSFWPNELEDDVDDVVYGNLAPLQSSTRIHKNDLSQPEGLKEKVNDSMRNISQLFNSKAEAATKRLYVQPSLKSFSTIMKSAKDRINKKKQQSLNPQDSNNNLRHSALNTTKRNTNKLPSIGKMDDALVKKYTKDSSVESSSIDLDTNDKEEALASLVTLQDVLKVGKHERNGAFLSIALQKLGLLSVDEN